MNALEAIQHFRDMSVLDNVIKSAAGIILVIVCSAYEGYDLRAMRDFKGEGYYQGAYGIDGLTSDGVKIVMNTIVQ